MFVFLSKLLPLFLYPLGFVCVLLAIALIMAWRQSSWIQIPIALALLVLLISSNGWISNWLVRSLEWQNLPQTIPAADAIILLGGATKSASYPRPMVDLNERGDRILYAAKLYLDKKAPFIIASGGRIDWFSDSDRPESEDMAQILEMMGVPSEAIIQEPDSLNTYQNVTNVKKILEARDINQVIVVTSAMHMPRSLGIFKRQKIDAIAAPTDFFIGESDWQAPNMTLQSIILNLLPDSYRLDTTTQALKEYIGFIIYRLRGWL